MKKLLLHLSVTASLNGLASDGLNVKRLVSDKVFYTCCPGPACIVDSSEDQIFSFYLADVIKEKGEVKSCKELTKILDDFDAIQKRR